MTRAWRGVAVPVKNHWDDFTEPLLRHLVDHEQVDGILVLDNGSSDGTSDTHAYQKPVTVADSAGRSLTEMWNDAHRWARRCAVGAGHVEVDLLLCNNDITLAPGTVAALSRELRASRKLVAVSPAAETPQVAPPFVARRVSGSYRDGGLLGWCFMYRAEQFGGSGPFDEQFEWWCADDDFAYTIETRGDWLARVEGIGVGHVGEGTASDGTNEWTHDAKVRDMARLAAKWPTRA